MAEEDYDEYVEGGYHPVSIGDTFSAGRYCVVRKLGWGHFSTVWLARDSHRSKHVALKVVKSAERYTETAVDEIKLLQRLNNADRNHPGRRFVVSLLDSFRHQGPNGIHVCMVFEVLGENLLGLIRRYRDRTIPVPLVKQIASQMLVGLEYMHEKCGIIHTDLKPENVLLWIDDVEAVVEVELTKSASTPQLIGPPRPRGNQTPRTNSISIVGSQPLPSPSSSASSLHEKWTLGMSSITDSQSPTMASSSTSNNSPNTDVIVKVMESVRLESPIGKKSSSSKKTAPKPSLLTQQAPSTLSSGSQDNSRSTQQASGSQNINPRESVDQMQEESFEHVRVIIADFGNATWTHHHFTDDIQTRQYRCPEVILGAPWGPSADTWSAACVIFELLTGGDYMFDPASASRYSKDDDHLAQILELLGDLPRQLWHDAKHSSEFFDENGKLKRIHKLRAWPMSSVLSDKYLFPADESALIASFLLPMLHPDPQRRVAPSRHRQHPWLHGIHLPQ